MAIIIFVTTVQLMNTAIEIVADQRERNSELNRILEDRAEVEVKTLPVGDYIVSDRIAIERKTVGDFQSSILNGRIFEQVKRLKDYYTHPIIIIEGADDDFLLGKNIFIGAVVSMYVDYDSTVMFSESPSETAELILSIAKHEQRDEKRRISLKGASKLRSIRDYQISIMGNMPGIGPKLAESMLRHFKNVRNIVNANKEELMKVEKIGPKKAEGIREVLEEEFKPD